MKNLAVVTTLVTIAAIGVALVTCLTLQGLLTLNEGIEIVTLGGLILVTSWYAYSTYGIQRSAADQVAATWEQAETSRRATEIALSATKNAVLPIVSVGSPGISGTQVAPGVVCAETVQIGYKNIGRGPALNLKVWLSYDSEEFGDYAGSTVKHIDVLGAGQGGRCEWRSAEESLPLPNQTHGYDVIAEFTDIYGRKFRSTLLLINPYDREFSFGQVSEKRNGTDQSET